MRPSTAITAPYRQSLDVWREAASLARCAWSWPRGWQNTGAHRYALARPPEGVTKRWPVVLIHGLAANRASMDLIAARSLADGFCVASANFIPHPTIESMADRLATLLDDVSSELGVARFHLVGHSLGGLLARYVAQACPDSVSIASVQTLACPHQGVPSARLAPFGVTLELAPGSAVYERLTTTSLSSDTRATSYIAGADMLAPPSSQVWPGASNVTIERTGHLGIVCSKAVAGLVATELAATELADELTSSL